MPQSFEAGARDGTPKGVSGDGLCECGCYAQGNEQGPIYPWTSHGRDQVLLQGFVEAGVGHVCQSCNEIVHKLAKFGCVNEVCNIWSGEPPELIVNILATEGAGV
jgi:hypothetical protein